MQATEAVPTIELTGPPSQARRRRHRKTLLGVAVVGLALTGSVALRMLDADPIATIEPSPSTTVPGIAADGTGVVQAGSFTPMVTTAPTADPAFQGGTGD